MNLNMYNNIIINKTLIKIVGCETALYWAQLMEIFPRVIDKKTYNEDGYFPINREYVEKQIGLPLVAQYNCDSILSNIGVLEYNIDNRNQIRVNPLAMNNIIIDDKPDHVSKVILDAQISRETKKFNKEQADTIEKAKKIIERDQNKAEKQEGILKSFKKYIESLESDPDLVNAYKSWLDSAYSKYGWTSKAVISQFITEINNYKDNKLEKLAVLNAAITSGYKDFVYVKSSYERNSNRAVLPVTPAPVQPRANNREAVPNLLDFN